MSLWSVSLPYLLSIIRMSGTLDKFSFPLYTKLFPVLNRAQDLVYQYSYWSKSLLLLPFMKCTTLLISMETYLRPYKKQAYIELLALSFIKLQ